MGACIEIVWLEGAQPQVHTAPYARVLSYFAMGKHLTADELDSVQAWRSQGISTLEIHRRLQHARATAGGDGPSLSTVRRALRGVTHRRGMVETRGRKRTLSPANIRAPNTAPLARSLWSERPPSGAFGAGTICGHAYRLVGIAAFSSCYIGRLCNNYVTTM